MTLPSLSTAKLEVEPAAIAVTSLSPLTATGTALFVVLPSPSWPALLLPQATTVPSLRRARLWSRPAAIAVAPLRNGPDGHVPSVPTAHTGTGTLLLVVVPSPSSPEKFWPQAMTVPSSSRARLWLPPPASARRPLRPLTPTGSVLQGFSPHSWGPELVPSPS